MINKNISIWRGTQTPPTNYHLWEKEDGGLYVYLDEKWQHLVTPTDKTILDEHQQQLDKIKNLSLTEIDPTDTNTYKSYQLKSDDNIFGTTINIPKDKFIKQVTLGYSNATIDTSTGNINIGTGLAKQYLLFSITLDTGNYELISINLSEFITEKDYSDGLEVVDNKLKVKIDPTSEDYLKVSNNGIKVEGINVNFDIINNKLKSINDVLYKQHARIIFTVSPTIIEKGINTVINLSWQYTYNDQSIKPESMVLKSNGAVLESVNQTYTDTINSTKSYQVIAVNEGVTKTSSTITVNAYYPMYFGEGSDTFNQFELITINNKRPIASNPRGDIYITFTGGKYLWLCIPSNMNISKVTSGGFAVPMETPITQTINESYKCYRSTGTINKGTVNFTIL